MGKILLLNLRRVSTEVVTDTARIIRRGGVILYPTDTIYGLGCNATDEQAIARIFKIKKRAEIKPMLVLVRNLTMLQDLVIDIPSLAHELAKRFWPGPLTMLFYAKSNVGSLFTAGSGKIGIRIPNNNFCLRLIKECRTPIVSTSANISGHPVSDVHSLKQLFIDKVDGFVDAGNVQSVPSTIIDITGKSLKIVREGSITVRELSKYS